MCTYFSNKAELLTKIGAVRLQDFDRITHIHVIITRARFISAESAVSSGQTYGLRSVRIASVERPRLFLFCGGGGIMSPFSENFTGNEYDETKMHSPIAPSAYSPIALTTNSSPDIVISRCL